MPVQHVVAFKFKANTSSVQLDELAKAFLKLKETCRRQDGSGLYISRLSGGKQDSPEGAHQGTQQVFLVEFENGDDRAYYVDLDPTHDAFKTFVGPLIESAVVLDFTEGVF